MFASLCRWSTHMVDVTDKTRLQVVLDGLRGVCTELGAVRGLYFGFRDEDTTAVVEADWAAPGLPPATGAEYTEAEAGGLFALLRQGQVIVCTIDGEEPELAPLRGILEAEELVADVIIPVEHAGRLVRAVVIDFAAPPRGTPEELRKLGQGIQELLAATERRRQADAVRQQQELRLHHQQKLESVGTMVGGVLHDVNNVLQIVTGLSELLAEEPSQQRQQAIAEDITQAAMRGGDLCKRILLFSRQDFRPRETFCLGEHLRAMAPLLRSAVPEDRQLELRIEEGTYTVFMPVVELEQAVVNLTNNAVDATAAGDRIRITCRLVDTGEVEISIADSGTGMDAATLARAREAFYTTKPPGEGTGLGLAMVQRAIEDADGTLTLHSAPGAGTTARLRLPTAGVPTPLAPRAKPERGGHETLLVVEDDAMVLRVTASALRRRGYTVLTARDGKEALAMLEQRSDIDLVVTDVVMPGLGGVALYRAMARAGTPPPFLFATGYDAGHLVDGFAPAPGRAVLLKPFTSRALSAQVRALLDAREQTDRGPPPADP